jgi:urease accessory protein
MRQPFKPKFFHPCAGNSSRTPRQLPNFPPELSEIMKLNHSPARALALIATLSLLPVMAQAHPGHGGTGFLPGFAHPLLGLDHILAMLAVGLWAAQLGGRAFWVVPAAFVSVMTLGSALGMAGIGLPFVEQGILASVLILGVLVAAAVRLPLAASVVIVGSFALLHGIAHGAEMPENAAGLAYAGGFALATALLHTCGLLAGSMTKKVASVPWLRFAGAAIAGGGVVLCFH